ncbi:MAG: NAD(P)/FAD-dependent oxidoreductase [Clostridiales bacterium]|nr:NAD(P)/FAD-dependent oxidoreductase [Clostridiales bacterium]
MSKVLVVGGGAAGLMAAGYAAQKGNDVTIIERNERSARKVMITGKGRRNVTNKCDSVQDIISNFPVNGRFLFSALNSFMPADTIAFFESAGIKLKVERGNRVFPVSDKAVDIVDALTDFALSNGARIIHARAKELIIENSAVKGIITFDNEKLIADRVLISTGGLSYPQTGSTGDGYEMAKQAGHEIIEPMPSLVPLVAHEGFCADIQGLSLKNVEIRVIDTKNNKIIFTDFGEMLFTHFGVSGPIILSASSHMREMSKGRYVIYIDLKPALTAEQLDTRVLRDFSENLNRNFINSLNSLLPKKLVPVIVKLSGIRPSEKTNQVSKEERHRLIELLKGLKVTVNGFRPIREAIVTSGGVKTSEINPKTMESKLVKGLYFAGEVIDVDAYTGGFNLQIAFSTAKLAGENI